MAEGLKEKAADLADEIKLFVKDEPHKVSKLEEHRERLISCLSLEDQMVDRCLFYPWVASEVACVDSVTAKAGWSPLPDGFKAVWTTFPEKSSLAVDKTAWDWTMPGWVVLAYLAIKLRQTRGCTRDYQWMCLLRMMMVVGPGAVFRLPTGRRLRQRFWGLMKSGWFLTLSCNSMAQLCQHLLAWGRLRLRWELPYLWAMGDDMLVRWTLPRWLVKVYLHNLSMTGCIVKHGIFDRQFAGFRFSGELVTPLYKEKHQYALRHLKPAVEESTVLAYSLLYALSGDDWLVKYHDKLGVDEVTLRSWALGLTRFCFVVPRQFQAGGE